MRSGATRSILDAQIEELVARVDSVHDKACKGVHDKVTPEEARLVVIHTYLLIAEVARLAKSSAPMDEIPAGTNDPAAGAVGQSAKETTSDAPAS